MIDQLLGCAMVKKASFTMSPDTYNIHLLHVQEVIYTAFHVCIRNNMRLIGGNSICLRKLLHILGDLLFRCRRLIASNLQKMNLGLECSNESV